MIFVAELWRPRVKSGQYALWCDSCLSGGLTPLLLLYYMVIKSVSKSTGLLSYRSLELE